MNECDNSKTREKSDGQKEPIFEIPRDFVELLWKFNRCSMNNAFLVLVVYNIVHFFVLFYFVSSSEYRSCIVEMCVRIRMQRFGRKNLPFYRIVVADSKAPRDGRFIEKVRPFVGC
jgi:hypothetical protein